LLASLAGCSDGEADPDEFTNNLNTLNRAAQQGEAARTVLSNTGTRPTNQVVRCALRRDRCVQGRAEHPGVHSSGESGVCERMHGSRERAHHDRATSVARVSIAALGLPVEAAWCSVSSAWTVQARPDRGGPERCRLRPNGTGPLGPCWVRVTTVAHGHQGSPAVAKVSEEPQVAGCPAQARGMMQAGYSDCVLKVR
jgi:hypothetical protein